MIAQLELVAKLDAFFNILAFNESSSRRYFPTGYESIFAGFATPNFLAGPWNGLALNNTTEVDRVYTIVFPGQNVLDKIIAREVERGAPGAIIFSHHLNDYEESGAGFTYITEDQLEELKEHHISYYVCHAPLDCHPKISTSTALANALKLRDTERFGQYVGGLAGIHGTVGPVSFNEFARKCAEAVLLPSLRYDALRHNGRPVQHVAIMTGAGASEEFLREALSLGCDTFVTGEWWLFGPGEWRSAYREAMRIFLADTSLNLIGTSHYASEAVVMCSQMPTWFYENVPGVEPLFIAQDDPWH
ncbi:MAG: Nif3-like dinuclear metal center hexameric protein [Chloroflexota bacterium]